MRTANFYKYVPKRFATADKGAESVRNFIYAFKDGRRDATDYAINLVSERLTKWYGVILFDDLITTGTTAEKFAEELEAVGANVLGAMFLARTVLVNK